MGFHQLKWDIDSARVASKAATCISATGDHMWGPGESHMGWSENVVYPTPNGFADHEIRMKNGYFIGGLDPIFRQSHI